MIKKLKMILLSAAAAFALVAPVAITATAGADSTNIGANLCTGANLQTSGGSCNETKDKLVVKARTAGINKDDLDVALSDNTLSIRGTLSAGHEEGAENYFLQECYWGEFSRSIVLPVPVQEDNIEAMLKDGVLTISFTKMQQDTVKKIQVL